MPADDHMLGQNLVDVRNEQRRAAWIRDQQTSLCTNDPDCQAQADEHQPTCPVEHQLREELGY